MDKQIRTICLAENIDGSPSVVFEINVDFPVKRIECHTVVLENGNADVVSLIQTNLLPVGEIIASTFDTKTVNQFRNPIMINLEFLKVQLRKQQNLFFQKVLIQKKTLMFFLLFLI